MDMRMHMDMDMHRPDRLPVPSAERLEEAAAELEVDLDDLADEMP